VIVGAERGITAETMQLSCRRRSTGRLSVDLNVNPAVDCFNKKPTHGAAAMARQEDWKQEVRSALRHENWSLSGPNRVVKIVPLQMPARSEVEGYITTGNFLIGKIPSQIERALGLPLNYLCFGARIYRFLRLPMAHEYEYELTAKFPDGLAFNTAHSNPSYPPGSDKIHQWRIKKGCAIPVDSSNALDLNPGSRFPYSWLA